MADAGAGAGVERNVRADQRDGGAARNGVDAEGRGAGRRAAQYGGAFRGACAQSAVRDPPAGVPAYSTAEPGAFAEEYIAAGPQHLPVLRASVSKLGTGAGPRCAAIAWAAIQQGKPGGLLLPVHYPPR